MDFTTIRGRLDAGGYGGWDALADDMATMFANAMAFNRPDTVFHKQARVRSCLLRALQAARCLLTCPAAPAERALRAALCLAGRPRRQGCTWQILEECVHALLCGAHTYVQGGRAAAAAGVQRVTMATFWLSVH